MGERFQLGFWARSFAAHPHELHAHVWKFLSSLAFTAQGNPKQEEKNDLHGHRNLKEPRALIPNMNKVEKRH